ncbi:MAG: 4Fe-4S binding protein [Bacteroidales bacterium]
MNIRKHLLAVGIVFLSGLLPALLCQFLSGDPVRRDIHIRSFRYGKDPSVIRCNRGDTLVLTFSSDDTGHSFYLEEFDVDAKVSPSSDEVTVFKTSDPTAPPVFTRQVTIVARHPGMLNWLVSKSNFRCHVWCGPMHAFEQGKLVIFPNTLLFFSLGALAGIFFLWFSGMGKKQSFEEKSKPMNDLLRKNGLLKKLIVSRWPQLILTVVAMLLIYIVILTSVLGTKVSGRNLGVLMMWAIWLFVLVAFLTPFFGRAWCTICPLPLIGDWFQRGSFFNPEEGNTGGYNNRFSGLFLKWPAFLSNDWPKLFVFMVLATFSTTLVATPRISGLTVLMLLLVPTLMAVIWELRAFCRFVCPVSVFVGPFSRMSPLTLGSRSKAVCERCKPGFCRNGSKTGWSCPYGINVGEMKENNECGLCLECMRSCPYDNVTLYKRPFAPETGTRNLGQAWLTIAIFTLAMVYSVLYEGHWPLVRDYVNILDKGNWDLFGIYTLVVWITALALMPGIIYLLSVLSVRIAGVLDKTRQVFLQASGALLPAGLSMWIAFVIPMLFVNVSFILQSLSDPFGWGWDFLGTANTPWHQLLPRFIHAIQAIVILVGTWLSLRNLGRTFTGGNNRKQDLLKALPFAIFLTGISVAMLLFFTN